MKEFFDPSKTSTAEAVTLRIAPVYAEYEFSTRAGCMYLYLAAADDRFLRWREGTPTACSFSIQTCVDKALAPLVKLMQDPVKGDLWSELIWETYPLLDEMFTDSEADHLERGGIRWATDVDTSNNKVMIVFAVDDVPWDPTNWETLHDVPQIRDLIGVALERSSDLYIEIANNTFDLQRALDLGLGAPPDDPGLRRTTDTVAALTKVLDWAGVVSKAFR